MMLSAINNSANPPAARLPMLLLEGDSLLRRTVVLTARGMGLGEIYEASSATHAKRMLIERAFRGAVIALDFGDRKYPQYDLTLIDHIRHQEGDVQYSMPIAVLLDHCDEKLLQELRQRNVTRVILKPFRARTLLETFAEFRSLQR